MNDEFERSSGNVYADLGHPEADTALAKARLILRIKAAIQHQGWTDEQAAAEIKLEPERLAALKRGRIDEFSTDDLIGILKRLNLDVEISIGPNLSTSRSARVVVHGSDQPIAASSSGVAPLAPVRFD